MRIGGRRRDAFAAGARAKRQVAAAAADGSYTGAGASLPGIVPAADAPEAQSPVPAAPQGAAPDVASAASPAAAQPVQPQQQAPADPLATASQVASAATAQVLGNTASVSPSIMSSQVQASSIGATSINNPSSASTQASSTLSATPSASSTNDPSKLSANKDKGHGSEFHLTWLIPVFVLVGLVLLLTVAGKIWGRVSFAKDRATKRRERQRLGLNSQQDLAALQRQRINRPRGWLESRSPDASLEMQKDHFEKGDEYEEEGHYGVVLSDAPIVQPKALKYDSEDEESDHELNGPLSALGNHLAGAKRGRAPPPRARAEAKGRFGENVMANSWWSVQWSRRFGSFNGSYDGRGDFSNLAQNQHHTKAAAQVDSTPKPWDPAPSAAWVVRQQSYRAPPDLAEKEDLPQSAWSRMRRKLTDNIGWGYDGSSPALEQGQIKRAQAVVLPPQPPTVWSRLPLEEDEQQQDFQRTRGSIRRVMGAEPGNDDTGMGGPLPLPELPYAERSLPLTPHSMSGSKEVGMPVSNSLTSIKDSFAKLVSHIKVGASPERGCQSQNVPSTKVLQAAARYSASIRRPIAQHGHEQSMRVRSTSTRQTPLSDDEEDISVEMPSNRLSRSISKPVLPALSRNSTLKLSDGSPRIKRVATRHDYKPTESFRASPEERPGDSAASFILGYPSMQTPAMPSADPENYNSPGSTIRSSPTRRGALVSRSQTSAKRTKTRSSKTSSTVSRARTLSTVANGEEEEEDEKSELTNASAYSSRLRTGKTLRMPAEIQQERQYAMDRVQSIVTRAQAARMHQEVPELWLQKPAYENSL